MAYTPNQNGIYQIPIADFGRRLQNNFGLTVVEHPEFGGVTDVHAPNSFHKYGEAIDIQDWRADDIDGVDWRSRTKNLASLLKGAGPEVLGPGHAGHDSHLHLAATNGLLNLSEQQYNYFFGGKAGGKNSTFTGSLLPPSAGGDPSTPSPKADIDAKPASTPSTPEAINAKYDQMRMAGQIFEAEKYGMAQHKKLFNKK